MSRHLRLAVAVALVLCPGADAMAAVLLTGSSYSTNFDSLTPATGTFNATVGVQSAIPGLTSWDGTKVGGSGSSATNFTADAGSTASGSVYSYGLSGNSDRALGVLASGTNIFAIGAEFVNNTGKTIASARVRFNSEQWRSSTATTNVLTFGYATSGATSSNYLTATGFTANSAIDAPAKPFVSTNGATDGNVATNRTAVDGTITGLSLANNGSIFMRWTDVNDGGNDAGIGLDDFQLDLTYAPEFTNTPYAVTVDLGARSSDVAGSIGLSVTDTDASQTLTFGTGAFPVGFYGSSFSSPTLSTPVTNGATNFGFNVATYVPNGTYNLPVTVTDGVVGSPVTINVAVTVIPEPTSLALLGGAAALLVTRRRR